ncbi:MAG: hypothetical protein OQL06_10980 [Gammaproteobacteria bacterium]|nr:hypothetical protein [Gammaproteobacteria bacterium]
MLLYRHVTLLVTMILGINGCAMYPNQEEQKVRISREDFSNSYRVAITSYQREADIDTLVMKTTIWTLLREGSVNEALSRITKLEKIDSTMQAAASEFLPSNAEILGRSEYGATSPIMGSDIVADDAMRIALAKGYDALLFVAVQPILTTGGTTGLESFTIQLQGLTQLHKVLPSGKIGGNTAILTTQDLVGCEQPSELSTAGQLRLAIDNCVNNLAIKLKQSFRSRIEN